MPANLNVQTAYIGRTSTINLLNTATLYKQGELGTRVATADGKVWQIVLCDSGPASVALGNVAFWMNKSQYRVTNKLVDCSLSRNGVAGVFANACTPGNYTAIQISGRASVTCTLNNMGQGDWLIANSGTASDVTNVAAGTAPGYVPLGFSPSAQAAVASLVNIDLTIGDSSAQT